MKILLLIISLLLMAFFSGSETAFVTVSRIKLEIWKKRRIRGARHAYDFASKPERFLTTTLIGTNIMLVAFSSLAAIYLEKHLGELAILVVVSSFLLIFGDIIPKTVFRELANSLIFRVSLIMKGFYFIFYPVAALCNWVSMRLVRLAKADREEIGNLFSKRDLEILIREGERDGVIEREERKKISKLFDLGRRRVKEVMIPRTEIVAVETRDPIHKVRKTFQRSGYSRLPVMDKDIDHIVGFVHARDLFKEPKELPSVIRDVMFVPKSKRCIDLLREFRMSRINLAIVVDEYGGTAGLVTLEDIIEEIFGEIKDEYDYDRKLYRILDDGSLIVNARAEIEEINEKFNLNLPKGEYETLGGLIITTLRRIPKKGEVLDLPNCKLSILQASPQKVDLVKVERK